MKIIEDNFKENFIESTYIALGSFDGLHLGHMSLINKTIELARNNGAKSMVFTFKNHPLMTINPDLAPKILMDNESKIDVLKNAGLDIINMANFNEDFMRMSPEDFVIHLLNNYRARGFVVGFNYRFGYKNLGDVNLLRKLSEKYKFHLSVIDSIKYRGQIVSSSIIRNIIADEGDMKKANKLLTRAFMIQGKVIHGKQLGRKLGFPTVNLDYDKKFVIPKGGVYYTKVELNGVKFKGITNVGYNPTTYDNKLSIETNILDFSGDVYDKNIKIYFIERIRDEVKFDNLTELANQLEADRRYVSEKN
ncbi:bifunctional riboflavin kinase/FAD synthetase [Clostridium luticellarii]|jgi:riboflavin kinase/FMN adenylyltransferase|uniref:Riboflavin biosynthesis protein n=1 Tax=Clostridium luticellarii TaxID=1691940 RepID=A0A2T0BHL5_9CLOT|nr:bifunctional riboflavin kinase/FAD synthetase [Clostridium luticellarii]MCI1943924.1 bifunctional riboflavin kinase/FAD synthetase [Clostridium luticellarii]MCI1967185.1 bifunctional riboflavin kinase/FAD synthetase [Clostridium luticellarii]MCI1994552.1 bifunctional riboflavin kinase/FAD synthetase [Clostridium luticellarii]MCI2038495.1 bifunctional riboflavin kinase/FAD synthetase [Clostridium luticellarii]PRR83343.1 Riboflavin biosynthesis protein RibF [Clostridium luticellarii]